MAAPRKYSDAQRSQIWRLHEAGLTSGEISATCAQGTAAVKPFEIPRRSVSDIVARIAEQQRLEIPESAQDVDGLDAVRRFPERIARIYDAEIDRLAAKQRRGKLTVKDLEVLAKATAISGPLGKRLEGSRKPDPRVSVPTRGGKGSRKEESAIERLARKEGEAKAVERSVSPTHTRPEPPSPADRVAQQLAELTARNGPAV